MKKVISEDVHVIVSDGIVTIFQSGSTVVLVEKELKDILEAIKEEDAMFAKEIA